MRPKRYQCNARASSGPPSPYQRSAKALSMRPAGVIGRLRASPGVSGLLWASPGVSGRLRGRLRRAAPEKQPPHKGLDVFRHFRKFCKKI